MVPKEKIQKNEVPTHLAVYYATNPNATQLNGHHYFEFHFGTPKTLEKSVSRYPDSPADQYAIPYQLTRVQTIELNTHERQLLQRQLAAEPITTFLDPLGHILISEHHVQPQEIGRFLQSKKMKFDPRPSGAIKLAISVDYYPKGTPLAEDEENGNSGNRFRPELKNMGEWLEHIADGHLINKGITHFAMGANPSDDRKSQKSRHGLNTATIYTAEQWMKAPAKDLKDTGFHWIEQS